MFLGMDSLPLLSHRQWEVAPKYAKDWPRASAFVSYMGMVSLSHSESLLIVRYHMMFASVHTKVTVRHVSLTSFPYTLDGWRVGHLLCITIFLSE